MLYKNIIIGRALPLFVTIFSMFIIPAVASYGMLNAIEHFYNMDELLGYILLFVISFVWPFAWFIIGSSEGDLSGESWTFKKSPYLHITAYITVILCPLAWAYKGMEGGLIVMSMSAALMMCYGKGLLK